MQNNNFTDFELEVIQKYSHHNKDIDTYFDQDQVIFLNDGYVPLDEYDYPLSINVDLSKKYSPWRYQVSLYKKLLDSADIYYNSKGILLDVSCGLGGGTAFYRDYYNFDKVIGVDLNPLHIDICSRKNKKVNYINASALRVPLSNESIDLVVSVESAGYFEDINLFLKEAWRLLAPGGKLIIANRDYVDMFPYYKNSLFKLVSFENITNNVRTSAAIGKYAISKIDPNGVITRHIGLDETLYSDKDIIYYIVVLQKQ
jgi:SAM-dependent methyltransferase